MKRPEMIFELEKLTRYLRTNRPLTWDQVDRLGHIARVAEGLVPESAEKAEMGGGTPPPPEGAETAETEAGSLRHGEVDGRDARPTETSMKGSKKGSAKKAKG